jgi:small multidrug resistance pump
MNPYSYLVVAIMSEVMATTALKESASFTRPLPSLLVVLGYGSSFYCFSIALRFINIGVAYAIWSGVGIVLISLLGLILYQQRLDAAGLVGIGLIIAGLLVLNLFSRSSL